MNSYPWILHSWTLGFKALFYLPWKSNAGVINTNITWSLQKLFFDINIWQCFLAILLCQPMQFHTNDTRLSTQYINLVTFLQSCATWKGEDCFHLCFREMEIPKFHINNFSQYFELITKVICACKNGGCMIYTDFFWPRKLGKYILYSHVSMNYSTQQEQKSSSSECEIYRNGFCGKFYGIASQRAAL